MFRLLASCPRRVSVWSQTALELCLIGTALAACSAPEGQASPPQSGSEVPSEATPTQGAERSSAPEGTPAPGASSEAASEAPEPGETSAPVTSPAESHQTPPPETPAPPPPTPGEPEDTVFDPMGSSIRPGSGPLGVETTCDGADDDSNGVVDDVDVASDGVCDCLTVATLGLHGEWGEGDVVTGWMKNHFDTPVASLDGQPLTVERLAPYQVVIIRDVSTNHSPSLSFSDTEVQALWSWVRDGGGLMTVIGYSDATEVSNVNRLLEPYGVSYGSEQIVQGQGAAVPVTEWFEHPLARGITQVGADNGYPAVGQATTVAAQDGFDVGKAVTIGDGHVLVWGDEWVTYEGEWSGDTSYQVDQFWKNVLRWLSRADECQLPSQ